MKDAELPGVCWKVAAFAVGSWVFDLGLDINWVTDAELLGMDLASAQPNLMKRAVAKSCRWVSASDLGPRGGAKISIRAVILGGPLIRRDGLADAGRHRSELETLATVCVAGSVDGFSACCERMGCCTACP
ncbi:hypothetical protein ACLOJK_038858 [Asimina triloba]